MGIHREGSGCEKGGHIRLLLEKGYSPLRLAKDNTWLVENGMPEPSHDAIGVRKTALLCAYDLSRIDSASAAKAAELHDFVVIEGLQSIYARE